MAKKKTTVTHGFTGAPLEEAKPVDGAEAGAVEEVLEPSDALSVEGRKALSDATRELDGDLSRIQKTRRLNYELTPLERREMRVDAARKLGERVAVDREVEELTEQLKRKKKRAEALDAEAVEMNRIADDGFDLRDVECVEIFDPLFCIQMGSDKVEKGALVTIRRDLWTRSIEDEDLSIAQREELQTEAIIERRFAPAAARQGALFS